jgi:hypothetical protein
LCCLESFFHPIVDFHSKVHNTITKGKSCHNFNHLEEPPEFLKIIFARTTIARFCQKVKDTLNQDKISPRSHASNRMLAVTITRAAIVTPIAVDVFILDFHDNRQIDSILHL